jgi:hypothetical protein
VPETRNPERQTLNFEPKTLHNSSLHPHAGLSF